MDNKLIITIIVIFVMVVGVTLVVFRKTTKNNVEHGVSIENKTNKNI